MEITSSKTSLDKQYSPFRTAVLICTVMLVSIYLWEMAKKEGILNSQAQAEKVAANTNNKQAEEKVAEERTVKGEEINKPQEIDVMPLFLQEDEPVKKKSAPVIAQRPEPIPVPPEEKSGTPTVIVARKSRASLKPVIAHVPHRAKVTKLVKATSSVELGGPIIVQAKRVPLPAKKSEAEIIQENAEAFMLLGKQAVMRGDYAAAIKDYHQAIALGIKTAPLYYAMARAYVHRQDHSRAIEYYSRTIRLSPGKASVFVARGVSYHVIREYQKAVNDYTQAIALRKNYALAYRNRSLAYLARGDKSKATKDIETAQRLEKVND